MVALVEIVEVTDSEKEADEVTHDVDVGLCVVDTVKDARLEGDVDVVPE